MKYFGFRKKISSDHQFDEILGYPNKKTNPWVLGKFVKKYQLSQEYFERRTFDNLPIPFRSDILDHFICYQPSDDIEYDWVLLDAFYFSYDEDKWPVEINGWLVSSKFKDLIQQNELVIGRDHRFSACKLKYQGEFMQYHICQYSNYDFDNVNLANSKVLQLPEGVTDSDPTKFTTHIELRDLTRWYSNVTDFRIKICFNHYVDVLKTPLLMGAFASERFKNLIEANNISGYEFWPVNSIDFDFINNST